MTDIRDIEQRAKDMIERCQRKREQQEYTEQADKIFGKPRRDAAKERTKKEAAERERQELEDRWNPWLEKAMKRYGQEIKRP